VRGLVKDVSAPVVLSEGESELTVGDEQALRFVVRDSNFALREGLTVEVELTGPQGKRVELPVDESITEAGVYTAAFYPEQDGLYEVDLIAKDLEGEFIGSLGEGIQVHPDTGEFRKPRYNPGFLTKISDHTGGSFYRLDQLDELANQLPRVNSETARLDRFHLWHFPPFFGFVFLLMAVEWYLRRRQGQP